MGQKNRKHQSNTPKQEAADDRNPSHDSGSPKAPSLRFLVTFGGIIIFVLSILQIIFNGTVAFVFGVDFITATYVTAAIVSTGAVLTMAVGVLGCLYCFLVFFAGMYGMATSRLGDKPPTQNPVTTTNNKRDTDNTSTVDDKQNNE